MMARIRAHRVFQSMTTERLREDRSVQCVALRLAMSPPSRLVAMSSVIIPSTFVGAPPASTSRTANPSSDNPSASRFQLRIRTVVDAGERAAIRGAAFAEFTSVMADTETLFARRSSRCVASSPADRCARGADAIILFHILSRLSTAAWFLYSSGRILRYIVVSVPL